MIYYHYFTHSIIHFVDILANQSACVVLIHYERWAWQFIENNWLKIFCNAAHLLKWFTCRRYSFHIHQWRIEVECTYIQTASSNRTLRRHLKDRYRAAGTPLAAIMFHTYRVCAWSCTPSDISCCGKHLVYPRLCHPIRESDGYKIRLILAGESPSPLHKSSLSGRRSLSIFFFLPPRVCLADGAGAVTQHSIPLFLLNIYTLVKHIKLTAGARITARRRSRIQCGSDSLPRMCALNKGEQQKTDRQTNGSESSTVLSKHPAVSWELLLFCSVWRLSSSEGRCALWGSAKHLNRFLFQTHPF